MRIATVTLLLFLAVSAGAATIVPGDVAVLEDTQVIGPVFTYVAGSEGLFKATIGTDSIPAFGPNNHVYAGGAPIREYDAIFNVLGTITPPGQPRGLAVAPNGDLYVLTAKQTITVFSPGGAVKQTLTLPSSSSVNTIDVAPDGCTLLYADYADAWLGGPGRRFDACTMQPLADLAPGPWRVVRALADGGYVAGIGATLSVFDAHDQLVRTYAPGLDLSEIWRLSFDADPAFLWIGTTGPLVKLRLADGRKVATWPTFTVRELSVNGETRPTVAQITASTIPTLTPPLLLLLGIALAALAAWRVTV